MAPFGESMAQDSVDPQTGSNPVADNPTAQLRGGAVVDTNAWVGALFKRDDPTTRALVAAVDAGRVLTSDETFGETASVLRRMARARALRTDAVEDLLGRLEREGRRISVWVSVKACADPSDDKFLALALAGRADVIVSSDRQVLDLHPFGGIPILKPGKAVQLPVFADLMGEATPR